MGERPSDGDSGGSGGGGTGGGGNTGGTGGTGGTPSHCENDRKDSDETDLDCGGKSCDPCADGKVCAKARDCESGVCTAEFTCAVPACDDGVKNGDENGVDCGNTCDSCLGEFCDDPTDCADAGAICQDNKCTQLITPGDRLSKQIRTSEGLVAEVDVAKTSVPVGHRLLLVAVTVLNPGEMVPVSVTYSGRELATLESDTAGNNSAITQGDALFAGVYVLKECDIEAATTPTVRVEFEKNDYDGAGIDAVLLGNAHQDLTDLGRSKAEDNAVTTIALSAGPLTPQSWFVGAAVNLGQPFDAVPPVPSGGVSTVWKAFSDMNGIVTVWQSQSGSQTFQWSTGGQFQTKAAAGIIVQPAQAPAVVCP